MHPVELHFNKLVSSNSLVCLICDSTTDITLLFEILLRYVESVEQTVNKSTALLISDLESFAYINGPGTLDNSILANFNTAIVFSPLEGISLKLRQKNSLIKDSLWFPPCHVRLLLKQIFQYI